MADAIAITKADGNNLQNAKKTKNEFENAFHLFPKNDNGWLPKVLTCSALESEGMEEIWQLLDEYHNQTNNSGFFKENRKEQAVRWMHQAITYHLKKDFYKNPELQKEFSNFETSVRNGEKHSLQAARELLNIYSEKK